MDPQGAIDLTREAVWLSMLVSAPMLLAGTAIGVVVGLLQALTQIQDQTIAFVAKLVAMLLVFSLCLPWAIQQMLEYTVQTIGGAPALVLGGG